VPLQVAKLFAMLGVGQGLHDEPQVARAVLLAQAPVQT
jgi:hypothetical protein